MPNDMAQHEFFMRQCLDLAKQAVNLDEVPIGALLVREGQVIETSFNQNESIFSPAQHAEISMIDRAAKTQKNWRLLNTTLYVTLEPCVMCTGAIYLARIPTVVFGCTSPKGGALNFVQQHQKNLNLNHSVEIVGGVLQAECATILKEFFTRKRSPIL